MGRISHQGHSRRKGFRRKLQAPTSKLQRSSNNQTPMQRTAHFFENWELAVSLELGAWDLELRGRTPRWLTFCLEKALDSKRHSVVQRGPRFSLFAPYLDDLRPPLFSSCRIIAGLRRDSSSPVVFCARRKNSWRSLVRRRGTEAFRFRLELQFRCPDDGRFGPGPFPSRERQRAAPARAGHRFLQASRGVPACP